jgi:cytidyltransferase-like protein
MSSACTRPAGDELRLDVDKAADRQEEVGSAKRCIAIGNFDGVHLGHQSILDAALEMSERLHVRSAVLSFEPHPRGFFARRANCSELIPRKIYSLRQKCESLKKHGIQDVFIQRFDSKMAELAPEAFVGEYLVGRLNVSAICVGEDFRFGRSRRGNVELLRSMGSIYGFDVACPTDFLSGGNRVSSSSIRELLAAGAFEEVSRLLGRPYQLRGRLTLALPYDESDHVDFTLRLDNPRPAIEGIFPTTLCVRFGCQAIQAAAIATIESGSRYAKVRVPGLRAPLNKRAIGASASLLFGTHRTKGGNGCGGVLT